MDYNRSNLSSPLYVSPAPKRPPRVLSHGTINKRLSQLTNYSRSDSGLFRSRISRSSNDFSGYTLIIPSICYGNIGQLAMELIINQNGSTDNAAFMLPERTITRVLEDSDLESNNSLSNSRLQTYSELDLLSPLPSSGVKRSSKIEIQLKYRRLEHIGWLVPESDCLVPVVGGNAFGNVYPSVSTAADVYANIHYQRLFVQFRSSLVPRSEKKFVEELVEWIRRTGFENVVILTSAFSFLRNDAQLGANMGDVRWVATPKVANPMDEFAKKNRVASALHLAFSKLELECFNGIEFSKRKPGHVRIPGGGFGGRLFRKLWRHVPATNCILLMRFTSEGDNTEDAIDLADHAAVFADIADMTSSHWTRLTIHQNRPEETRGPYKPTPVGWKIPDSWSNFYGPSGS